MNHIWEILVYNVISATKKRTINAILFITLLEFRERGNKLRTNSDAADAASNQKKCNENLNFVAGYIIYKYIHMKGLQQVFARQVKYLMNLQLW